MSGLFLLRTLWVVAQVELPSAEHPSQVTLDWFGLGRGVACDLFLLVWSLVTGWAGLGLVVWGVQSIVIVEGFSELSTGTPPKHWAPRHQEGS